MKANFFELEYNPKIDYLITKNFICSFKEMFITSIGIALISYFVDFCYAGLKTHPRKRKIVLDILPDEKEQLINDITDNGYIEGLEFLTEKDLKKSFPK